MINIPEFLQKHQQYEHQLKTLNDRSEITRIISRGFLLPETLTINSVLFVGINPAFNPKYDKPHHGFGFYPFDSTQLNDTRIFNEEIQYFRQMHRLSQNWTTSWSDLDLFCFRETNQNFVKDLMNDEVGRTFPKIQFDLFYKIICLAQPKVIVVCNSLARDILNYESFYGSAIGVNLQYEFDEQIGTPRIISDSPLKGTPVFFSSMLSGQRALDRGSFQRLGWHINFALNHI